MRGRELAQVELAGILNYPHDMGPSWPPPFAAAVALLVLTGAAAGQAGTVIGSAENVESTEGVRLLAGASADSLSPELWQLVFARLRLEVQIDSETSRTGGDAIIATRGSSILIDQTQHRQNAMPALGENDAELRSQRPPIFSPGAEPTGSNPSGSGLVWSGRVFAIESRSDDSVSLPVVGEVKVEVSGGEEGSVTVTFFNLVDLSTGQNREAITWEGLGLSDGFFEDGNDSQGIRGGFLGESHSEAGGTFQRDGFAGAFSAIRHGYHPDFESTPERPRGEVAGLLQALLDGPSSEFLAGGLLPALPPDSGADGGPQVGLPLIRSSLQVVGVTGGEHGAEGRFESRLVTSVALGPGDYADGFGLVSTTAGHAVSGAGGGIASAWSESKLPFGSLLGDLSGEDTVPSFETSHESTVSWGFSALTTPSRGAARWEGLMIARDTSDSVTRGNRVIGDALLSVGLAYGPEVRVEFTRVRDVDAGLARSDIKWDGIPVINGMFFSDEGGSLRGAFSHAGHETVTGVFERDNLSGGFTASQVADAGQGTVSTGAGGAQGTAVHVVADFLGVDALGGLGGGRFAQEAVAAVEESFISSYPNDNAGELREHRFSGVQIGKAITDIHAYGYWLEDAQIAVALIHRRATEPDRSEPPVASIGFLSGPASHSSPADLSARWKGALLATDAGSGPEDSVIVHGSAEVTLQQGTYVQANVRFREVADLASGKSRPDMTWLGIPIIEGKFHSATATDWLRGQFLGENQPAVGGSFDWLGLRGVFAASKAVP